MLWKRKSNDSRDKGDADKLDDLTLLESNKKVKEGKITKILTPNKLITKFSVLLAQIKAGNNSYKLKSKIRQIVYHKLSKVILMLILITLLLLLDTKLHVPAVTLPARDNQKQSKLTTNKHATIF